MAANHLGIILGDFAGDLQSAGYSRSTIQDYLRVAEHFGFWLGRRHLTPRQITAGVMDRFVRLHSAGCRCPKPAATPARGCCKALHRLLELLQSRGFVAQRRATLTPIPGLIGRFDHYMSQVCGLAEATRLLRRRTSLDSHDTRWG
jgi:hypothetical protein